MCVHGQDAKSKKYDGCLGIVYMAACMNQRNRLKASCTAMIDFTLRINRSSTIDFLELSTQGNIRNTL